MDREIIVDYDRLKKQLVALYRVRLSVREVIQLEGLFDLIEVILKQRPFKEGKD